MIAPPITVVTGCGRCGTSMVMQMLRAGGMRVVPDEGPAHEDQRAVTLPGEAAWLAECRGAAIKILDIHTFTPPPAHPYRFIVLTRDTAEQAASQIKMLGAFGNAVRTDRRMRRSLTVQIAKDEMRIRRLVAFYPDSAHLLLRFENVLTDPLGAARAMAALVDQPLDVDAMAAVVIRRPPQCLAGMLEFDFAGSATRAFL